MKGVTALSIVRCRYSRHRVEVRVPESEVFGWSRSRIPDNTGSRSRIFLSDFECPIGSFFKSHSFKLGIPVEMIQFLLKLLLQQRFLAVHHDFH